MKSQRLIDYLTPDEAARRVAEQARGLGAREFACVRNLAYAYAPAELYPLAPHTPRPLAQAAAFAVDMDGTSTTTEPLALHALEYMVRRFTGWRTAAEWPGLDPQRDHPHVIGNSNFRHTEFLLERYGAHLRPEALCAAFIEALVWTLANMTDARRRRDVQLTARNCGLAELLADPAVAAEARTGDAAASDAAEIAERVAPLVGRYGGAFAPQHLSEQVSAALDVYYYRYHTILRAMEAGAGDRLSRELLGDAGRRLIEPMPGYGLFVPLVKGWLGEEAGALAEMLLAQWPDAGREPSHAEAPHAGASAAGASDAMASAACKPDVAAARERLTRLGRRFGRRPARLALVTASIAYEAHAVMREVIRVVRAETQDWPVSAECRARLAEGLADYRRVFDGFVDAAEAHEARLKPHRDLYSIALYQMSIPPEQYPYCIGLEDTEPGVVALRAAGFGCAVALPNRDTAGQDYRAAAEVVRGGLPELILGHNLLLEDADAS